MARLHRKRGPMHEINVVPYVDVMLVLLVIFMVTAPLITPGVIDLPSVDKAGQPRVVPLEVYVRQDGSLMLRERDAGGGVAAERDVTRAQLGAEVRALQARVRDLPVLIGGDKGARYEAVLAVMDELRKQGIARVGLQVRTNP